METVQLYLAPLTPKAGWPVQELRGFVKLDLEPGQEKEAVMLLRASDVPGPAEIRVGSSSRDIRSRAVMGAE